jgi:hypothetical protein
MKYDTIELNAELVTQPGYSALVFSYGLKINGSEFHPEHSLDLTSLVKSCQWSGPLDIFTCSCGEPGCAGIFQGIEVRHAHSAITWKCPDPLSVSEDTPDLWEHGVTTFEHFSFNPDQYMNAIDLGIKKIKSLAILSTSPFEFPVHGVEFDQVMSLEKRPFSSHCIDPAIFCNAALLVVEVCLHSGRTPAKSQVRGCGLVRGRRDWGALLADAGAPLAFRHAKVIPLW